MTTTDQTVPDAAVQIVAEAIAGRATPFKTQRLAEDMVAALARAGWLYSPDAAAALRAVGIALAEQTARLRAERDAARAEVAALSAKDDAR